MPNEKLALYVAHTTRWRLVSNKFPLMVTKAYEGDIASALKDDDATVFARVRAFEVSEGLKPRDWVAIGKEERDEL